MAHILFLSDFEQGHLFPTFGLAHSLIRRGHRVSYIGIPDMEPYVERQGLELHPIFSDLYPAGASARLRAEAQAGGLPERIFTQHLEPLVQGELDDLIAELKPDLLVSSLFLSLETLILYYRYQLPMAVFTQCLRSPENAPAQLAIEEIFDLDHLSFQILELAMNQGHEVTSMEQLVAPLAEMPELIACPRELDLPGIERPGSVAHIEPCIRAAETPDAGFPWDELPSAKKLILVSLGSQTEVYLEPARQLYRKLFEMMRAAADEPWHFVISVGKDFDPAELGATVDGEAPDNVTLCHWLPQLQLLDRAALMVGHGGLGTIKECAYFGVPMVIVPLSRDQPDNARRVEHHGFGLALDPVGASAKTLLAAVRSALEDGDMAAVAQRLQEVFRQAEDEQRGAVLLEGILSGERPMAAAAASEAVARGFAG